jgi:hypothetical protein
MRKEKTQISKMRNTKWEITTNIIEIQEIITDYFESLYSNKFEICEEMDKFLDTYDHPKLNQQDINHLNKYITQNEIETAIKSLPKKKVQYLVDSQLSSIKCLKKNSNQPSLNSSIQKGKEHCLTHFMKSPLLSSQNQTKIPPKRTIGKFP